MANRCFLQADSSPLSCSGGALASSTSTYCLSGETGILGSCTASLVRATAQSNSACYYCPSSTSTVTSSSTLLSSPNVSATTTRPSSLSTLGSTQSSGKVSTTPKSFSSTSGTTSSTHTASTSSGLGSGFVNGKTNGTAPTPGNSGISDGVAAGIGIGCAIVGAILAALIVFFLLRRKRGGEQFYGDGGGPSNGAAYSNGEKGPVVSATSVKGGAVTNIDRLLPLPAEDNEIIGGLSRIRDDIKNHVQNYYGNAAVRPEMIDEGRLRELAQATGISTPAIASLLLNPATRIPAIRLLIAQFVLSRCIGRTDGQPTFLPLEVSHLAGHPITAAQTALFSKWKTISGVLLQRYKQKPLTDNDARISSIRQALTTLDPILQTFTNPSTDQNARQRNLEAILSRVAQFAFLIFTQPGSFAFDFKGTGTGESGGIVVFPALVQTVSDEAEVLARPRVLSEREVVMGFGA